jgi:hypothetical protein
MFTNITEFEHLLMKVRLAEIELFDYGKKVILYDYMWVWHEPGNTKGGSITVPLTSYLTGLESAVWQLTSFVFMCKTD